MVKIFNSQGVPSDHSQKVKVFPPPKLSRLTLSSQELIGTPLFYRALLKLPLFLKWLENLEKLEKLKKNSTK